MTKSQQANGGKLRSNHQIYRMSATPTPKANRKQPSASTQKDNPQPNNTMQNNTKTTVARKIGSNRGKARLWLEGVSLSSQLWKRGDRFDIEFDTAKKQIVITRNPEGKRKIAGTDTRPIIDTNSDKITETLRANVGDHTSISITGASIIITKSSKLKQIASKAATLALVATASLAPLLPYISTAAAPKRILVACEYSGRVRDAFVQLGHDAISADLLPSEGNPMNPHALGDVRPLLDQKWDMIIAFPPCTYLTSAALWRNLPKHDPSGQREAKTKEALQFVRHIMSANAEQILVENPVGCIGTQIRKADQSVQPWQFGHPESKRTCLWLNNLPLLQSTNVLTIKDHGHQNEAGKWYWQNQTPSGQNRLAPSADRWKKRSLTYQGIADAIATQYS